MAKLIFKYWNYQGYYNFVADICKGSVVPTEEKPFANNNQLTVKFKTKGLNYGITKEGILIDEDARKFVEYLDKAELQNWDDAYYPEEQMIADQGSFNICYVDDKTNIYFTRGEEGCEPEAYYDVIAAIKICDPRASRLIPKVELDLTI